MKNPKIEILETQDGSHSLFSEQFGVSYHSKYGAIQESTHVFLKNGLHLKLPELQQIKILEMGFGGGLNALLTLLAAETAKSPVEFHTYEAFPISEEQAAQLNYAQFLEEEKTQQYFSALHTSPWENIQKITPFFHLQKHHIHIEKATLSQGFDLVYFDAFAPTTQPELWGTEVLGKIYDAMNPGGIFVTYCAKGVVKRTLRDLGMEIQSPPGPPGKREMTRAIKL